MRKLTTTLSVAAAVLLGSSGLSWGKYTVKGNGVDGCGEILSHHNNGNKTHFYTRRQWILGYITGRNYETGGRKGAGVYSTPFVFLADTFTCKAPILCTTL